MQIKYYGHSCFSVQLNGKTLLFDPFISPNELAQHIDISKIKADYIFLSHAHQDHIFDALDIAKNNNATIVGVWEISEWAIKNGHSNTHPMNIGGFWNFDFGTVQMVSAVHSSSFSDGSYGGQAAGFVVKTDAQSFYYSGDTALTLDMQLIPLRHQIDIAFLPIGNNFTMDAIDAVKASDFIQCNTIIAMHYDTFGFIKIDQTKTKELFENQNKKIIFMTIEQEIEI